MDFTGLSGNIINLDFSKNPVLIKDSRLLGLLINLLTFTLVAMVAGLFVLILVMAYFSRELPNPNNPGPDARMVFGIGTLGAFLTVRVIVKRVALEYLPD